MRTRRGVLRALGTGSLLSITGCSRAATGSDPPPVTPAPVPKATTDATHSPIGLALEVELLDQFHPTHPASLRLGVTNTDDVPLLLNAGRELPFLTFSGNHSSRDANLVIVPQGGGIHLIAYDAEGKTPPVKPVDGCWRLNGSIFIPGGVVRHELPPNESITQIYRLYAHWRNDTDCIPPGTYEFTEQKPVKKRPSPATGEPAQSIWASITLAFAVNVSSDQSISVTQTGVADAE